MQQRGELGRFLSGLGLSLAAGVVVVGAAYLGSELLRPAPAPREALQVDPAAASGVQPGSERDLERAPRRSRPRPESADAGHDGHHHGGADPVSSLVHPTTEGAKTPAERPWTPEGERSVGEAYAAVPEEEAPPPVQVERTPDTLTVRGNPTTREVPVVRASGLQLARLEVEGYDVTLSGPDGFTRRDSYGIEEEVRLGASGDLGDGRYKYTVTPRLQSLETLRDGPVPADAPETENGRNSADPAVLAGRALEPIEPISGTFHIQDGRLTPTWDKPEGHDWDL